MQKLVGTVIAHSSQYVKTRELALCSISKYSISRMVNANQEECQALVDDLIRLGWLFKMGDSAGAKSTYALTFSLIPMGEMKE